MTPHRTHTLILGTGPAGLAASYVLAQAGRKPVVLEKANAIGGLMRSIHHGDFIADIGRKELYNRLARVDDLWAEVLGSDYRQYPHRGGILYKGHIIEISASFRGFRRGMPWTLFGQSIWDMAMSRVGTNGAKPTNLEQYYYQKRGRRLTQVISQGFQEKLSGIRWADVSLPDDYIDTADATLFSTVKSLATRTFASREVNTFEGVWRHPARGTGQICEALANHVSASGGTIVLGADVLDMKCIDNRVTEVVARINGANVSYEIEHLVSSIPSQHLLKYLLKSRFETMDAVVRNPSSSQRVIVLVYLFLNEEPRFPHAWLNVTCPDTRMGRVTNYAALGGDMVPRGRTCLCCELFLTNNDALLEKDNNGLVDLVLSECARHKLVDPSTHFDSLVIRLPGADASQNRHNWMNSMQHGLFDILKSFRNVYYVARTDLDIATLAGVEAAEAILSGDRASFDHHVDPANLPIRSVKKTFEFRNPLEQQA